MDDDKDDNDNDNTLRQRTTSLISSDQSMWGRSPAESIGIPFRIRQNPLEFEIPTIPADSGWNSDILWESAGVHQNSWGRQNFRLELRMVNQQVLPANWASQELVAVQDELVWRTFPEDDDGYIVGRLPETNVGLVAENWRDQARKVLGSDKSALSVIDILLSSPFFVCPSLSQVIMSMYKKKPAKSLPPENAGLFPVNTAPKSLKAHKAVKGNLYTPAGHFVQPFKPGVSKKADPFQPLATTLTFENEGDTVHLPGKKQKQFQHWETEFILEVTALIVGQADS
ncbi:uncharacterized protein LACBIDRAFT_334106 [Laccaria bicolor S238N-H82]|uniref:Predicted protein n=1 Tax=Laccaria bicolor (strain S238N-H82 / ATCC MYA-4686) TaxID=486041 RepID=B0DY39_LACBS|nr:uncharacterized protein LACBIDRAFT_334106 [Laccaria bicolor S238N-H82]EDR00451.1 predicted protein [Laccaria bicolor S238N-H82]|eukprot:XP_001888843.1 predicted protein [Laccaria bicolor S238N-H82]